MRTTDFERVGLSVPLDATAATVRDGRGEHWDPEVKHTHLHWDVPPPMRSPARVIAQYPSLVALYGHRKGRLRVAGLLDFAAAGIAPGKNTDGVWVCRCDCGQYEGRKAKALRNPLNTDDMCGKCMALRRLQHMAAKPSTKQSREASAKALDKLTVRR